MLKFIWNSWWRNKERFILLLVGVLILSTGLSYLIGITQANNATVVDELQKRWQSSYHIVVRPEGSRSVTEELNLLEPNYLSGMDGGITLAQYEQIKAITDVEIAAPIAMMGSIQTNLSLDSLNLTEPGIYRLKMHEATDTGADIEESSGNMYVTVGDWRPPPTNSDYGAAPFDGVLTYGSEVMIAGIDPAAESTLVGIDQAIVASENSHFFTETDVAETAGGEFPVTKIPVIVSNRDFVDATMTYTLEKLDFPFNPDEQTETMEAIKESGGTAYLEKQTGTQMAEYVYTTADVHESLVEGILDPAQSSAVGTGNYTWMPFKPSPINYRPVFSPFGDRWPFSYEVQPFAVPEDSLLAVRNMYRAPNMFGETSADWPNLQLDYIGVFDPQKLQMSKDPLTELPMETYFPANAQWVMDANDQPVNPPTAMKPINNPYGFLTKPPLLLTTIEAAAEVLGEEPISAIRVNVAGVETLNEESETKLQAVAQEIEEKTGLITDVTLGSSPQLALTHLPGLEEEEELGWVQQPWIKLGSSITIFQETKVGLSGVIASVILVAIVYVFSSNLIMMFARKKEFAVLLALGWRPAQLSKMLFLEATILGLIVAFISWLILGLFLLTNSIETSGMRIFLIGVSGLAIYWVGSIIPAWLARKIKPYETMKTGEISHGYKRIVKATSVFGMSINYLFTQWKRSILSVIAIAVPTSLFIFFLFVTFRLKGVLYATWLGEFVALEVGTMHYVAMGVALLIAILTTAEIMWQNVAERQPQIAVLKAMGWQNKETRLLVLYEGLISGFIAGIIGLGISIVLIAQMYGQFPSTELPFLLTTLLIPVITGVAGATLPAEKAVRIHPYQAMSGGLNNSKKTEKQFKVVFGAGGAALFAGVLALLLISIPELESNTPETTSPATGVKTEGEVTDISSAVDETASDSKKEQGTTQENAIREAKEKAWRVLAFGETTGNGLDTPSLSFGELVETPKNLEASRDDLQLVSVPVVFEYEGNPEILSTRYQPQRFLLIDDSGNEYSRVDMEIIEQGGWKAYTNFFPPSRTEIVLTYEIPKEIDKVALVARGQFIPGDAVLEIPLPN